MPVAIMKEDTKPSNVACNSFIPHRFRATQCGRCLKSHAQHKQFMKKSNKGSCESRDLHSSQESSSEDERPGISAVFDKVTVKKRISAVTDESGNITTDYFAPDSVSMFNVGQSSDDLDSRPRRHIPLKSAARRTREAAMRRSPYETDSKLNIPVEQSLLNNLSTPTDADENKDRIGWDSSENGCENNDRQDLFQIEKKHKNHHSGEDRSTCTTLGLSPNKALRASRKSSIPIPKPREFHSDSRNLQEFQEVAMNLRHVPTLNLDLKKDNRSDSRVVNRCLSSPGFSVQDLESRQRINDARSSQALANMAHEAFAGHSKHGTLPRNLGSVAPRQTIQENIMHQRQTSDPVDFQDAETFEISVVSVSPADLPSSQGFSSKKQVVTSSKISSEVFFGSHQSPSSKHKCLKTTENSQEVLKSFLDQPERPVMIVAADGSVSHYQGSTETSPENSDPKNEFQRRLPQPRNLAKPYKVVDISHKPPEHQPEFDIPVSPKLPTSPSPRYKLSDVDVNDNTDEGSDSLPNVFFHKKDHPARISERNADLVDGMSSAKGVSLRPQSLVDTKKTDLMSPVSDIDGETTTLPILLSETESESSDRRRHSNSSNYKVPIYISPRNYDNVGTVLSDMDCSVHDLSKDSSTTCGEETNGYLMPMLPIKEMNSETPPVPVRTSSHMKLDDSAEEKILSKSAESQKGKLHSKKLRRSQEKEPNTNNSQSSPDSRWRFKTHPLGTDPIYAKVNFETKKSASPVTRSNTDVGKSKQKRVAPLPPNRESRDAEHVLPDSLPRGVPPPPPVKERRQSTDTLESSEVSASKPAKPTAPSPPSESQLGVIYEVMNNKSDSIKTAPNQTTTSSPKPQPSPRSQSGFKQFSTSKLVRVQSLQVRQSETPMKAHVLSPDKASKSTLELKEQTPSHAMEGDSVSLSSPISCTRMEVAKLPDSSPQQSPSYKETKSKRSKLPWWRRRKRDDQGSPERDFDASVVEKWLEGVHPISVEEGTQRNSMDRLEVINAYKGEHTAFINHHDLQSPSPSTSPEQNGDDSDGSGLRLNTTNKRRAPQPPAMDRPASWMEGTQVSPNGSPEDKRRASDGDKVPQYENTGVLRQKHKKPAPPKPERRQRSRTTGFENLLSHREVDAKPPGLKRQSSSDPDLTTLDYKSLPDSQPIFSAGTPPLKSALKSPGSFEMRKAETDTELQPKRPVRIVVPTEKTCSDSQGPGFVNIYSNIAIMQRGLGASDAKPLAAATTAVVFTAEAETQTGDTETAVEGLREDPGVCESILTINRLALARLAGATAGRDIPDQVEQYQLPWSNSQSCETEPCCSVPGGVFFRVIHPNKAVPEAAVLIATDTARSSDLLHVAQCCQTLSAHPNVLNVWNASTESVPYHLVQLDDGHLKVSNTLFEMFEEVIDTTVVLTDRVPLTNVESYVSHNKELHDYLPEKYEHDAAVILLQLLNGLWHLQMNRVCPESLKAEHLLLADSGLPGKGSVLLINLLTSHLQKDEDEQERQSPVDIYRTPEQIAEKIAEFDVGLLVYELLHRPNPFAIKTSLITQEYEPQQLPPIPARSKYSQGLGRIAGELLRKRPSDRLSINHAIGVLQCLLWGPLPALMEQPDTLADELCRWLVIEQARITANMSEYCIPGYSNKDTGYSITDQLHCQFLSDASVASLAESMKFLYQ